MKESIYVIYALIDPRDEAALTEIAWEVFTHEGWKEQLGRGIWKGLLERVIVMLEISVDELWILALPANYHYSKVGSYVYCKRSNHSITSF
jgi:hypothetical protein